jgi:hypothetical protein
MGRGQAVIKRRRREDGRQCIVGVTVIQQLWQESLTEDRARKLTGEMTTVGETG